MPGEKKLLKVFVSHAPEDASMAKQLYDFLKEWNIEAWLDDRNLLGGQDEKLEIPTTMQAANVVILCLSQAAVVAEGPFQRQIRQALDFAQEKPESAIFVIPALLDECEIPHNLARYKALRLFDEGGFDLLLKSLEARAAQLELSHSLAKQKTGNLFTHLASLVMTHARLSLLALALLLLVVVVFSSILLVPLVSSPKIEIILDVSNRMSAEFDSPGISKFDAAKEGILQLLDTLDESNSQVALRLLYSKQSEKCSPPETSLAVDFTRDYDEIRQTLHRIQVTGAQSVPLVGTIDQAFNDYQNSNFTRKFSIFTFIGGDDTCGKKLDMYLRTQDSINRAVITNLFLIIMLDKEPAPPWLDDIKVSGDYIHRADVVHNQEDVRVAVEYNSNIIVPPTPTPEPSNTQTIVPPTIAQTIEYISTPTATTPTSIIPNTGPVQTEGAEDKNEDNHSQLSQSTDAPQEIQAAPPTEHVPVTALNPADTKTATKTVTPTATRTVTATVTKTITRTVTATNTPLASATATRTKTLPPPPPATDTATWTPRPSATKTSLPTSTETDMPTPTATLTPTATSTSIPPPLAVTTLPIISTDVFSTDCILINEARVFDHFSLNQASIFANVVPGGSTNNGLQLDFFNISGPGGNYAGWEVWLGANDESGIDLSAYNSLAFYIRGNLGGEEPNVYLMMPIVDEVFTRHWVAVNALKPVTTSWQEIVIPLSSFGVFEPPDNKAVDLSNIVRIQILFEWYEQPRSGTIFIDDLCVR